jgi:ribosomal protein S18 acetylase RimI-like enzyme
MIRFATKNDLNDLAKAHSAAFPKSFTTQVGLNFVRKTLEWYLTDDKKFLLCVEEDHKAIGYCGCLMVDGNTDMGSTSAMIQYAFKEAVKGLLMKPWLFFHPELSRNYKLIFKNIKRKIFPPKKNNNPVKKVENNAKKREKSVGIVGIGILPAYYSKGYGSQLIMAAEKESLNRGFKQMHLTVRNDNERAIRSYTRNGWVRERVDKITCLMTKQLS